MGRRVNLAELAVDDFEPSPQLTRSAVSAASDLGAPARRVPISSVAPNPLNKRQGDDVELAELAETIREHGVIQPLVVCSTGAYLREFPEQRDSLGSVEWVALIGNRRLRAAHLASLEEITIVVNDEQVTSMYEVMLVENGQRRELPPWLEAEAMAEVLKTASISQRELARRIGKSHMYVSQRLALLKLIPELRLALEQGELKIEQAREFGELPEVEQRAIAAGGKPYRRPAVNAVSNRGPRPHGRAIRLTNPAEAAESISRTFNADELAELVRLLSERLASAQVSDN